MDFIDNFYKKDENGKKGHERSGNRLQLSKTAPLNVRATFNGFELKTFSNKEDAKCGEKYGLVSFTLREELDGNGQEIVEDQEYKLFYSFDTKTVKASRQAKEMESFTVLVADIMGESRKAMLVDGQAQLKDFIANDGEAYVGKEYRLFGEKTGEKNGTTWYRFSAEEL